MDSQNKKYWDAYSSAYAQFANNVGPISLQLWNMLKVRQADSIFECGVGSGYALPFLFSIKQKTARLIACDISEEMLRTTRKRIDEFEKSLTSEQFGGLDDMYMEDEKSFPAVEGKLYHILQGVIEYPRFNTQLRWGNAEDVTFLQNESIDVFSSSLVLHLVDDPIKMLKEANRVLKKGGRVGCSVWGSHENSDVMTFAEKVLEKHNIKREKPPRTPFHLNDSKKLRQMFQDHGFTNIITWTSIVPMPVNNQVELDLYLNSPKYKELFDSLSPENLKVIKQDLLAEVQRIKAELGRHLQLECLVITAEKQ